MKMILVINFYLLSYLLLLNDLMIQMSVINLMESSFFIDELTFIYPLINHFFYVYFLINIIFNHKMDSFHYNNFNFSLFYDIYVQFIM